MASQRVRRCVLIADDNRDAAESLAMHLRIDVHGWGQAADKARAVAAGLNHHLTKPIQPDALTKVLRSEH